MPDNTTKTPFRVTSRVRSFGHAFAGLAAMLRSQHNAWIHACATLVVLAAGLWVRLSAPEWCWIVLAVMAVWTAEALNTAVELLADAATPEFHPLVKRSKDVAAAAVLISAIGAAVIALLVFGPRVIEALE